MKKTLITFVVTLLALGAAMASPAATPADLFGAPSSSGEMCPIAREVSEGAIVNPEKPELTISCNVIPYCSATNDCHTNPACGVIQAPCNYTDLGLYECKYDAFCSEMFICDTSKHVNLIDCPCDNCSTRNRNLGCLAP